MSNANSPRRFCERIMPPGDMVGSFSIAVVAGSAAILAVFGGNWQAAADGDGNGRDSASYIADLDPSGRFQHDYNGLDDSGDDCLSETGYDLWDSGRKPLIAVGTLTVKGGVYIIEPGGDDRGKPALRLQADSEAVKDGHLPLQPAPGDGQAAKILGQYECALTYAA